MPLRLREEDNAKDGGAVCKRVVCIGLTEKILNNVHDTLEVLKEGTRNRMTAATLMNDTSSRSHAIPTIAVKQTITTTNMVANTSISNKANDNFDDGGMNAAEQEDDFDSTSTKDNFSDTMQIRIIQR